MRVILRPAALLIEPFSSARLLFFPLPVAAKMSQGRGGSPRSQVHPFPVFPVALLACTQALACSSRGGWARSPHSRPALPCVPMARPAPALASFASAPSGSYHVRRSPGGRGWNSCLPCPGCRNLRSASLGTVSECGGRGHR